jgi:hypothetical protein
MKARLKPFGIYHSVEKIDDEADHNRQEHVRSHDVASENPVQQNFISRMIWQGSASQTFWS